MVNVLHRLSDTAAAGPAGSATRALAEGVIADSGTWVLHRQRPSEQQLLTGTLGLNQMPGGLPAGLQALWTRFPSLPFWAQILLGIILWPALVAMLVAISERDPAPVLRRASTTSTTSMGTTAYPSLVEATGGQAAG